MRSCFTMSFSLLGILCPFYSSTSIIPHASLLARPTNYPSRNSTDKRTIIENYDLVTLAIDEIVDDGIVLETDPVIVSTRVSRAPAQDAPNMKNIDLSEQGLLNMWEYGRRKAAEAVRNNL